MSGQTAHGDGSGGGEQRDGDCGGQNERGLEAALCAPDRFVGLAPDARALLVGMVQHSMIVVYVHLARHFAAQGETQHVASALHHAARLCEAGGAATAHLLIPVLSALPSRGHRSASGGWAADNRFAQLQRTTARVDATRKVPFPPPPGMLPPPAMVPMRPSGPARTEGGARPGSAPGHRGRAIGGGTYLIGKKGVAVQRAQPPKLALRGMHARGVMDAR